MSYEKYESSLIQSFERDIKNRRINPHNRDLNNIARNKYNRYIENIISLNPREYKIDSFPSIDIKDILEISQLVIYRIYGIKALELFLEFVKRLSTTSTTSVLDGINLTIKNKITHEIDNIIEVPDITKISTIICIVHEFTHYYFEKLNISFNKKKYYEEIFSIYAEKVACQILEECNLNDRLSQKIEETRLDSISWYYKEQLPAVEKMISLYEKFKRNSPSNFLIQLQAMSIESQLPTLKSPNGANIVRQYYQNMAESYGLGYLYGESLYQQYIADQESIFRQTQALTNHSTTIEDLLKYYGINASNQRTYDNVTKRLTKIREGK